MAAKKGGPRPKGSGRKKGTVNHMTTDMKETIVKAFDELGGVEYLVRVGQENPAVFCTLLGRILPREVHAEVTVSDKLHQRMIEAETRVVEYEDGEYEEVTNITKSLEAL